MAEYSKQVKELGKMADNAEHVYEVYGAKIITKVQKLWQSRLTGRNKAALVQPFVKESIQQVSFCKLKMQKADIELVKEQGESKQSSQQLDEDTKQAKTNLHGIIHILQGMYGADFIALLGLSGRLPQQSYELLIRIQGAIKILNSDTRSSDGQFIPFTLPKPIRPHLPSWNKEGIVRELQALEKALHGSTYMQKKEVKQSQDARIKRRQAISECKEAVLFFNFLFERLARMVQEIEIADRIRPRGGRPKKKSMEKDKSVVSTSPTPSSEVITP